jgi:hypothetical protein
MTETVGEAGLENSSFGASDLFGTWSLVLGHLPRTALSPLPDGPKMRASSLYSH